MIAFQALLYGPVLEKVINGLFFRYIYFSWNSNGFILPFFYFKATGVKFEFLGYNGSDKAVVEGDRISGWINPLGLMIGRIYIHSLNLTNFQLTYINRTSAYKKVKYLPAKNRLKIIHSSIIDSRIFIEDRTFMPVYKINLTEINVEDWNMDSGTPVNLLFLSKKGYCKIGSGELKIGLIDEKNGRLSLQGIKWSELAGLRVIPLPLLKNKIDLETDYHHHEKNTMEFLGRVGQLPAGIIEGNTADSTGPQGRKLNFRFTINWDEYALPFDLAFRKLITQLLVGLRVRDVVGLTIHSVTKGIAHILRARDKVQTENEIVKDDLEEADGEDGNEGKI